MISNSRYPDFKRFKSWLRELGTWPISTFAPASQTPTRTSTSLPPSTVLVAFRHKHSQSMATAASTNSFLWLPRPPNGMKHPRAEQASNSVFIAPTEHRRERRASSLGN